MLIEEEDYSTLRDSIDNFDRYDTVLLAKRLEKHALLEFRRLAAHLYKVRHACGSILVNVSANNTPCALHRKPQDGRHRSACRKRTSCSRTPSSPPPHPTPLTSLRISLPTLSSSGTGNALLRRFTPASTCYALTLSWIYHGNMA